MRKNLRQLGGPRATPSAPLRLVLLFFVLCFECHYTLTAEARWLFFIPVFQLLIFLTQFLLGCG